MADRPPVKAKDMMVLTSPVITLDVKGLWEQAMREQERLGMMLPIIQKQLVKCGMPNTAEVMKHVLQQFNHERGKEQTSEAQDRGAKRGDQDAVHGKPASRPARRGGRRRTRR